MKKILPLLLSLIILLSACANSKPKISAVTTGISFEAQVTHQKEIRNYKVVINKNGDTKIIEQLEKDEIMYHFSGDFLEISYQNLTHKTEISSISNNIILDFLYSVFLTAGENKNYVYYEDSTYYLKAKNSKYDFLMTLGQSGLPLNVKENNFSINAQFTKMALLN